jgi:energy-coupling factor transport system ATP-binding protein
LNTGNYTLLVKDLYYRYPGRGLVLRGLNLVVSRGEHVIIIGDTGSGKTTLARVISKTADLIYGGEVNGEIYLSGMRLSDIKLSELHKYIHVIGQNPYLYFTAHIVREDLYNYALRVTGSREHAVRAFKRVVEALGLHSLLDKYFYELSGGEAKRVAVSKALIPDPELLVFDEPLMWLDDRGIMDFQEVLRVLRYLGKSVIVLEHRFIPIARLFDRIYLLDNGRLYDVTDKTLRITRQRLDPAVIDGERRVREIGDTVLRALNITQKYNGRIVLNNVNIEVRRGESILIYGLNGSGKTTLLKILAGYLKPSRGRVERLGRAIYIPQNIPLFFTEETIGKEITEICRAWSRGSQCIEEGLRNCRELGLSIDESPFTLSHGQMVKLAILIARLSGADIILLDEPFSGLTYIDRAKLIDYISSSNSTFILATSNLDAIGDSMWSQLYGLEEGTLKPLNQIPTGSLKWASIIYEEIKRGLGN